MKRQTKTRTRASAGIKTRRPRSRPPRSSANAALVQSEARFRSLADLSSDWYWEQDSEMRFVSTSGQASGRGGITAADHPSKRRWELPGTKIESETWGEHQATLAARRPFRDLLLKRTAADGTVHYVSVSGEPIFSAKGVFSGYRGNCARHHGTQPCRKTGAERRRAIACGSAKPGRDDLPHRQRKPDRARQPPVHRIQRARGRLPGARAPLRRTS